MQNIIELNTSDLCDINIYLFLTCDPTFSTELLTIWFELIEEYSLLSDFFSDYIEPKGGVGVFLERMERVQEIAWNQQAYTNGVKRWFIIVSSHFFKLELSIQKSVLLHEIGHIIVYEKKILEELRSKWPAGESLFDTFIQYVKQDGSWFEINLGFLKEIFDNFVFDILKIPGEIYANQWVKQNCINYFLNVIKSQYNNYLQFDLNIHNQLRQKILKYAIFCTILRLDNLLLTSNGTNVIYVNINEKIDSLLSELKQITSKEDYDYMINKRNEIIQICKDVDAVNKRLFDLFKEFIENNQIMPEDFLSI